KYDTSSRFKSSSLAPSDRHSAVHPPVNALGNQATTTGRPRVNRSARWYVRPSDPGSVKSGARSPTASSTGLRSPPVTIAMIPAATALAVAATMRNSLSSCMPNHVILNSDMWRPRLSWRRFCVKTVRRPNSRIAIQIFVSLLGLFVAACGLFEKSPTAPGGPPGPGSTIVYTAIGASDATGHGASIECLPFQPDGCPNGLGYVQVAIRQLRAQGFTVTPLNLGIPTDVIGRDFQTLGAQYGRQIAGNFIEQEMPFVQTNATLVSIFAGGNEVNTITAALGGGAGASDQAGFIDAQVRAFGVD